MAEGQSRDKDAAASGPRQPAHSSGTPQRDSGPTERAAPAKSSEAGPRRPTPELPPAKRTKRAPRGKKFNQKYLALYGLKVSERGAETGEVTSVSCQFCIAFGREKVSNAPRRKRALPRTVKRFDESWRTDAFVQHLKLQHQTKWKEYQDATSAKKQTFFDVNPAFVNTITPLVDTGEQLFFWVRKGIVEDIIGGLFLDASESEESIARALCIFKKVDDADAPSEGAYKVTINDRTAFTRVIKYVSAGLSFRQARTVLDETCNPTELKKLASVREQNVRELVRVAVGVNLQRIADILNSRECWAFSIVFDGATQQGKSLIDVRARVFVNGDIVSLHMLASPIRASHTGTAMAELVARLLDGLCAERTTWKKKLVGIATDGARALTGRISEAVTRLASDTAPGLFRAWCGAHELDIVMQEVMSSLCSDAFYTHLTDLIGHLRRQQSLIAQMGSTCPTVAQTQWLSLGRVTKWLYVNRSRVHEHLENKKPACTPPPSWWIALLAVESFLDPADACFRRLQGLSTLIAEQDALLDDLCHALRGQLAVEGPLSPSDIAAREADGAVVGKLYATSTTAVDNFIMDLGIFAQDTLTKVSEEDSLEVAELQRAIGKMFIEGQEGITSIRAERSFTNGPSQSRLPPVLPCQLALLQPRDFNRVILEQRERLLFSWDEQDAEGLEHEFRMFKRALHNEPSLQGYISKATPMDGFAQSWAALGVRFPKLRDFCGGLATVFPGTSTVESDFSTLNWEFDEFRKSLTEFSLEGIMQSKQFFMLDELHRSLEVNVP